MYNFDDVMIKLEDIETKLDVLIEKREKFLSNETTTTVDYFSTHWDKPNGERRAEVFRRGDGVWGIEMYIKDAHYKTEVFEGHSESYAEDAAENFVLGIKN